MSTPLAQRLHHTAYVTKDQEATRAFYEDILGFPLLATWSEADELFGAVRVYCHTFFGLADGTRWPSSSSPTGPTRTCSTRRWRRRPSGTSPCGSTPTGRPRWSGG